MLILRREIGIPRAAGIAILCTRLCLPAAVCALGSGENGAKSPQTPQAQQAGEETSEPSSEEMKQRRRTMVQRDLIARGIEDEAVLEAMRSVPRHRFVQENYRSQAYADKPLPIGEGQTISQPYIVAYMTEVLDIEQGDRVLEVGTGSGYQAAVLAEITDKVYSIEIIEVLAERAKNNLEENGYSHVEVNQGDGYYGWKKYAPFDAVIVTAAAGHIPPPLLEQLKPGGRMVIPIGGIYEVQSLMLVEKTAQGETRTERLMPVRFVPFTGEAQE